MPGGVLGEQREVPICRSCLDYQDNVTVMEMLCASPYITTFVCLTIEARYRLEGASLDPTAHMTRHHLGARGNTITFPLVWEDLFRRLHHPCRPAPEPQRALRRAPSNPQNQQDGPDFRGGPKEVDLPGKNPAARGGATHPGHAPLRTPFLPGYPRRQSQGEGKLVAGGWRAAGIRKDLCRPIGRVPGKAPAADAG